MKLLAVSKDVKTIKGEKQGYLTGILYLSPANESKLTHANGSEVNLCPFATKGCKQSCLYTAGRAGIFPKVNLARKRKTEWFIRDRAGFTAQLRRDIEALQRKADRLGMVPAVRINGTSDQPSLAMQLAREYPTMQFYDYTKIPRAETRVMPNYDLTFSLSEANEQEALRVLATGKVNVAVVFDTKRGRELPATWNGYEVIDGDLSDLRFRDQKGVVIGLRAKGRAKKDESGFVRSESKLVQIERMAA